LKNLRNQRDAAVMTRFDFHIIRRLLAGFITLVAVLIVFFIVLHYVEYVDDFFDRGATMRQVFLLYYPSYIPEIVKLTSPLALFLACVYLTAKLAQSLQLTALQTSGVSLYRLLLPYLIVAITLTGFMFWFNGWIVPKTNRAVLEFEQQYLKDASQVVEVSDIHRQNQPGSFLTVGYYDRRSRVAHRISLQQFNEEHRLLERIDAPNMTWIDSLSVWRIEQPVVRDFRSSNGIERRSHVARIDTTLRILPRDLARTERDVESMTIPAAAEYIEDLERSGAGSIGRTKVGFYGKFAYPFANLILALIAMPLSAVRRRGGQAVQMGLGLIVAFAYLAIIKLTEPFGYTGELRPLIASWMPHVLFFAVALVMLFKARK
jgi:lipopolysaccharide export system permease protein